jgi:hypothetical protein
VECPETSDPQPNPKQMDEINLTIFDYAASRHLKVTQSSQEIRPSTKVFNKAAGKAHYLGTTNITVQGKQLEAEVCSNLSKELVSAHMFL